MKVAPAVRCSAPRNTVRSTCPGYGQAAHLTHSPQVSWETLCARKGTERARFDPSAGSYVTVGEKREARWKPEVVMKAGGESRVERGVAARLQPGVCGFESRPVALTPVAQLAEHPV